MDWEHNSDARGVWQWERSIGEGWSAGVLDDSQAHTPPARTHYHAYAVQFLGGGESWKIFECEHMDFLDLEIARTVAVTFALKHQKRHALAMAKEKQA